MVNEKQAIENMRKFPNMRDDLFTMKSVMEATELSRTMLIKLENEGFVTPRKITESGWRYYDTFSVFKLLQYKRLRLIGFSKSEIFEFYRTGNESLDKILKRLRQQKRLLDQNIETLSLRVEKERNYSFSFYDFDELTCLTYVGEVMDIKDSNALGFNLSTEALARGLRPLVTEEMFCENEDRYSITSEEKEGPWHVKVYQPIDPDSLGELEAEDIEFLPACHTFSILIYGLQNLGEMTKPRELLLAEMKRRNLTPTGAPVRIQAIVTNYTAMHLGESAHVMRIAVPVEG